MQDRWSARRGEPILGPKAALLARGRPGGEQKWRQNRPKTGVFPGYSQSTPKIRKKALVLPLGHICAGTKAPCALPLAIFGDKNRLYTAFRGVLTPRIAVYSASRMQGKQGKRPRRVAPQGWPPQGWHRRAAVVFIVTGHAVLV